MKNINILYGYSGTLKSSITKKAESIGYIGNESLNTNYQDLFCKLRGQSYEDCQFYQDSINLIINYYLWTKKIIDESDKLILNRSLIDYRFFYHDSRGFKLDDEYLMSLESELFESANVKRFLLINKSNVIFDKLKEKCTRPLDDYAKMQDSYVDHILSFYSDCKVYVITDLNIEYVINTVIHELI